MPSAAQLWDRVRHRPNVPRTFAEIQAAHVLTPLGGPNPISPQRHYFGIIIDELFLADSRQLNKKYDPMVLAITEFTHGGETATLPFVVGPKLLSATESGNVSPMPEGMLYRRTRVAGIHPFRGGRITSTVVLCQVERRDVARQMLNVVESFAGAVPFGHELGTYTKLAGSLLDGMDSMLGLDATVPLAGIRQEFDHDLGTPIRPAYFALIDAPERDYPASSLWVRDGSLFAGPDEGQLRLVREASYVLFSTRGAETISDLDKLPQHARVDTVLGLAATAVEAEWKRAKAELLVLYRELLTSPDLTRTQANAWFDEIEQLVVAAHRKAARIGALGPALRTEPDELRASARLLDLE